MLNGRLSKLNSAIEQCLYTSKTKEIDSNQALSMVHFLLRQTSAVEGIVYVIGNGGSAGIASHFSTDLLRTLEIGSVTLFDSNHLTCFSNDFGYERVFEMPLRRLLRPKDLLIAISSSGKSENILRGVQVANEIKAPVVTFSGFSFDNPLRGLGDLNFWIESSDYGLVEMSHFVLLHTIIDTFEKCKVKSKNLTLSSNP